MKEFISVAEVDALLPMGWQGSGDKDVGVMQANTYLNTLNFKAWDSQPDAVTQAGAELARLGATGELFKDTEGTIKRKKVKADTVESEKEYAEGSQAISGAMQYINALLAPWVKGKPSVKILGRL